MLKKHLLVTLLLVAVSFGALSAHAQPHQALDSRPMYVFEVFGVIRQFRPCIILPADLSESYKIEVTFKEGGKKLEIYASTDQDGSYSQIIHDIRTPDIVTLIAMGSSISRAYTGGSHGRINMSLIIGIGVDPNATPNQL